MTLQMSHNLTQSLFPTLFLDIKSSKCLYFLFTSYILLWFICSLSPFCGWEWGNWPSDKPFIYHLFTNSVFSSDPTEPERGLSRTSQVGCSGSSLSLSLSLTLSLTLPLSWSLYLWWFPPRDLIICIGKTHSHINLL